MLRILTQICIRELFDDSLDLVTFSWESERRKEVADGFVDWLPFVIELRRIFLKHLLAYWVWGGQVLANRELTQARGPGEEANNVAWTLRKQF